MKWKKFMDVKNKSKWKSLVSVVYMYIGTKVSKGSLHSMNYIGLQL